MTRSKHQVFIYLLITFSLITIFKNTIAVDALLNGIIQYIMQTTKN